MKQHTIPEELIDHIHNLINNVPSETITAMSDVLFGFENENWKMLRYQLSQISAKTHIQQLMDTFTENWETHWQTIKPVEMGYIVSTAKSFSKRIREESNIEIIWTGPKSRSIPVRRTDQALLDLINQSDQELILVSFAVYKAKNIMAALDKALERDVNVKIILEEGEDDGGKLSFNPMSAFSKRIQTKANFYRWPIEKREKTEQGKVGSLHAKVAVADRKSLFLSSANLTDYAMRLNMEMGVLIHDENLANKVYRHFDELIFSEILVRV